MPITEAFFEERVIAVREHSNLHIVLYQQDVTDGMCGANQGVQDCMCKCSGLSYRLQVSEFAS